MRGSQFWQHQTGQGAEKDDMRNICELLINVVNLRQAKGADRLGLKSEGYGQGSPLLSCAACDSPGE